MIPALRQAASDPTLKGRSFQVYVYLCHQLDPVEYRHIKFAAESKTLGIQRPHFSKAISHLLRRGYLESVPDDGDQRRQRYRLRYSIGG